MWLRMVQLQQGFGTNEMGFNGAVAGQQFQTPNVSQGSKPVKPNPSRCLPLHLQKLTYLPAKSPRTAGTWLCQRHRLDRARLGRRARGRIVEEGGNIVSGSDGSLQSQTRQHVPVL